MTKRNIGRVCILLLSVSGCKPRQDVASSTVSDASRPGAARSSQTFGTNAQSLAFVLQNALAEAAEANISGIRQTENSIYFQDQAVDDAGIFCTKHRERTDCQILTRSWPHLSAATCAVILPYLGDSRDESGMLVFGESSGDRMWIEDSNPRLCKLMGMTAAYVYDWERPPPDMSLRPESPSVVEEGARDIDCTPLPHATTDFMTELASGTVNLATYVAPDGVKRAYYDRFPEDSRRAFEADFADPPASMGNCSVEELYALRDYAGGGFHVNNALRRLKGGRLRAAERYPPPPEPGEAVTCIPDDASTLWQEMTVEDDITARLTASAVRCMRQVRRDITFRGANLTPTIMSRYQPGTTIVEKSFVSTAPDGVPDNFIGNVEFRIFDAVGAVLGDLNPQWEETELLINAGTLFKVIHREEVGTQTIVYMHQIP